MGMLKEFKDFAMRGNLVDIAVAFVMGASFGKIVTSFVDGIVMPLIGMLTGGVDFNDKVWVLKEAVAEVKDATGAIVTEASAEVSVKYGAEAAAPAGPTESEKLLAEIRDSLKKV